MIRMIKGNILEAEADVLVNTVNSVGIMGKGIAFQFKKHFPENYAAYKKAVNEGIVKPGSVFLYPLNTTNKVKFIANFATKNHWRSPSRIEWIKSGLSDLKEKISNLEIDSIAIPPLGCGHGGLKWDVVREIIIKEMSDLPLEILCYEPTDEIKHILKREDNPKARKLTNPRASLLYLLFEYRILGEDITEFVAEKLCYFLQRAGADNLRLTFKKGFYGPYSGQVRHVLHAMNGYYLKGLEQKENKPFEPLELVIEKKPEIEDYIRKSFSVNEKERLNRVVDLIQGFETPYGLELLATVDFLISGGSKPEPETIIDDLEKWSDRKGEMFGKEHIELAIKRLDDILGHQTKTLARG